MILIGRDLSPFVRRTAIILHELGLPFERRIVASATDAEEITRSNPLGRVPALVADDESVIIDSAAIIDYAIERAGNTQQLLAQRGLLRQQTLFYSALATGAMEKGVAASYERVQKPKEYLYEPWLEKLQSQMANGLSALEHALDEKSHFIGDTLTIADINVVVAYDFGMLIHPEPTSRAAPINLPRLSKFLGQRPAFANTKWEGGF